MPSCSRRLRAVRGAAIGLGATACLALAATASAQPDPSATLVSRAVLPSATFLPGPDSGAQIRPALNNGVSTPFVGKQPVQGVSALLPNRDGSYWAMSDNGYGSIENSAEYNLRVYRLKPSGWSMPRGLRVLDHIELSDPDRQIPFTIANEFTDERVLTGADFDIESMQRTTDGTLWFGDEFGPFILHTDHEGRMLEPPIAVPDPDDASKELRAPQNPFSEESSALRIMNAVRAHARANGATYTPVFSPWFVQLKDADPATSIDNRQSPPAGSGLDAASSELHDVKSLQAAGFPVVTWTVNDKAQMTKLLKLGVNGIISDRTDLLRQAVAEYDANGDGTPGDYLLPDGRIDPAKFDAQGHRGSRNLRPENTLPAMEVSLDNLMTTLETDTGVTSDGVSVLSHDPYLEAAKCRRADGEDYKDADQKLIKDLTVAQIQAQFICDKVFRGPTQLNDPSLSPVTAAFAKKVGLAHIYAMPTVQQLFDFVAFYQAYYTTGAGASAPDAKVRAANAATVRFNLETKVNPRSDEDELGNVFAERTKAPEAFVEALAGVITRNGLSARADIQSFDFRTLLQVQEEFPAIRTVYLFGDFPKFADPTIAGSDDGTNMQTEDGENTPWMAGMYWPYRQTAQSNAFRVGTSGGFEGMALTKDGRYLMPLVEKALTGDPADQRRILRLNIAKRTFERGYIYPMDARGAAIGDFQMVDSKVGLVLERDNTQGDVAGFKALQRIRLGSPGSVVAKRTAVNLQAIRDPFGWSGKGLEGDVGLGTTYSMPFVTIESIVVRGPRHVVIANDNNYPFSVGRHVGTKRPDDTDIVDLRLGTSLLKD